LPGRLTPCYAGGVGPLDRRRIRPILAPCLLVGVLLALSSCAADPNPALGTGQPPAGFLLGLWHGLIIFFTFVISLFTDNVSIYEVANSGNWYDAGFFLGVMISLGGGGGATGRARRRRGHPHVHPE